MKRAVFALAAAALLIAVPVAAAETKPAASLFRKTLLPSKLGVLMVAPRLG